MGIKSSISLYRAFLAAGFSLSKLRSVPTADGSCWNTTLKKGKTEILRVSNGGFGGPDELESLLNGEGELTRYVNELYAVPEIAALVRDHVVFLLELEKKYPKEGETRDIDAEIEAAKKSQPQPNEDATCVVIGQLSDIKQTIDSLKRRAKGKILMLEKCEAGDSDTYLIISAQLTAESRAQLNKRYAETLDVILNDLIEGL